MEYGSFHVLAIKGTYFMAKSMSRHENSDLGSKKLSACKNRQNLQVFAKNLRFPNPGTEKNALTSSGVIHLN
jgi:hypothetical protein